MSKIKFTKVAVSERLPEKGHIIFIERVGNKSISHWFGKYDEDETIKKYAFWLEESPDREDEMREMLEKIRDGKIRPREYVSEWDILNDFIESLKQEK